MLGRATCTVLLGSEGVRKRMHLEDHHDTPKDCMDLGSASGSYLDYIYLDFIRIFIFFTVKDNERNENYPCKVFEMIDLHLHTDISFYQVYSSKLPKRSPNTFLFCLETLAFSLLLYAVETLLL